MLFGQNLLSAMLLSDLDSFTKEREPREKCSPILNHNVNRLFTGDSINLCETYADKVILIVNTACKCVFTPQFKELEHLYNTYGDRGFVVLGFPSNDFGDLELRSEKRIQKFCRDYGVHFPMFSKTHASKRDADPLYRALGEAATRYPSWNFHKYLLDREGQLFEDFISWTTPNDIRVVKAIEALL